MRKTKILVTLGPASTDKKIIAQLVDVGMDACRINLSHGSIDEYDARINNVRAIKDIPIIFDTQGPEIRIHTAESFKVKYGQRFNIGFSKEHAIFFSKDIRKYLKKGTHLLLSDGIFKVKILKNTKNYVEVISLNSGLIANKVRVNIPTSKTEFDILSEEDIKYLRYAKKKDIDFVAVSYARTPEDIQKVRVVTENKMGIIAKIENSQGLKNFEKLLAMSDGILVARGDLGSEIPTEKLPLIQKQIIKRCNESGKLVITATQMLQSMVNNPSPTRAETSDVANAILDGTDMVMLSAETAIGSYPVLSVKEMTRIANEAEDYVQNKVNIESCSTISEAISKSIYEMVKILPITKIITLTKSGYTARMISRFRLKQRIIAVTTNNTVRKRLELVYGVTPVIFPQMPVRERILKVTKHLRQNRYIQDNDLLLFTAGIYAVKEGSTNLIEVHKANELLKIEV